MGARLAVAVAVEEFPISVVGIDAALSRQRLRATQSAQVKRLWNQICRAQLKCRKAHIRIYMFNRSLVD
jgi:hypothetical protein